MVIRSLCDPRGRWPAGDGQAKPARDRDDGFVPERAALCFAAQHDEGEEEAARSEVARRLRRGHRATPEDNAVSEPPVRQGGVSVAISGRCPAASPDCLVTARRGQACLSLRCHVWPLLVRPDTPSPAGPSCWTWIVRHPLLCSSITGFMRNDFPSWAQSATKS